MDFGKLLAAHLTQADRAGIPRKQILDRTENVEVPGEKEKRRISESILSGLVQGTRRPTQAHVVKLITVFKGIPALNFDEAKEATFTAAADVSDVPAKSIKHINGIVRVHLGHPVEVFQTWIGAATKHIWIFDTWLENPMIYKDSFLKAARRQANNKDFTIKIMLLDANADAARQRSIDLWLNRINQLPSKALIADVPKDIARCKEKFEMLKDIIEAEIKEIKTKNGLDFLNTRPMEIRTHKNLPSISIYVCDNKALIGFYVHGDFSSYAPQLEVHLDIDDQPTSTIEEDDKIEENNQNMGIPDEWRGRIAKMIYNDFTSLWEANDPNRDPSLRVSIEDLPDYNI